MAKRMLAALACVCAAVMLAGCGGLTFQNVNDLLRAPALGQGQDEIQKALTSFLGGVEPQYKFPKGGDWRSPLVRADFDGDGRQEAVLLYGVADATEIAKEKGSHVYMAVLEMQQGEWQVTQDVRGLSSDVASLEVADLLGDGTKQLIVGFSNANLSQKTLGLYSYNPKGEGLERLHSFEYSRYEIGDFTGRGGSDLVVVSRYDQPGSLRLQYVPTENGVFLPDLEPVKLDNLFISCEGIAPGIGMEGERVLVVDGVTSTDNGPLASQIVYYSNGRFYTVDDFGALRGDTGRQNRLLLSRDIDGDGAVEIPSRQGGEIATPAGDKKLEYVVWKDFTDIDEGPVIKQFGLLDSDRSVYIHLPDAWQGELVVADGENRGEWKLQRRKTMGTLLSLKVLELGDTAPMGAMRVPGSVNSYLVFAGSLSEEERATIQMVGMG
ncbi:hypothetical protein LJB76_02310 [Clostridia bacterium OttesenSCG-928-O13]|nr:hypothetical protein [Clostridia bacterium OttesenSCG-928-O13]